MRRTFGVFFATACAPLLLAANAFAQASEPQQQAPATSSAQSSETRPATTTFQGDTGLWMVPTGEILPAKRWSVSFYRHNVDRQEGFTDISNFIGTFGYGISDRVELFGSVEAVTRIDRDVRPLYIPGNAAGGFVNDYPFISDGWSGNKFGDVSIGAKFNILSEYRQQPMALAVRGILKLPTGDKDSGAGTGKVDFTVDAIASKELGKKVELAGNVGYIKRGDPDDPFDVDISDSFRYGIGIGVPTRSPLRITGELVGEKYSDDGIVGFNPISTGDVLASPVRSPLDAVLGATFISPKGFFIGGGLSYALKHDDRSKFGSQFGDESGDKLGFQFRIGYHPGVRVYAPPPPPVAPTPMAVVNRPPTVKARCEPCIVEVGKSSTITADGQDPDGDTLTYKWTTPSGSVQNPADRQTLWTAPMQEGTVPVTVTVDDGKSGTATDTVQIQVVKPAVKEVKFEDVHFDFDRYTLRPEAARILDEAIKALQDNPSLKIEVEGHTCNIGTAEYNLALGERRAVAVKDYLASRGVTGDRLRTVSYGEERPKYDNAREETRRLNRRAALVVRVTQ